MIGAKAGTYRQRISIVAPLPSTPNTFGETPISETEICECWAGVKALSGRELFEFRQVQAEVTHAVEMRFRDGIAPDQTILYSGMRLNIESVYDPDGLRVKLIILAKARV